MIDIELLNKRVLSNNIEESVNGIDQAIGIVNQITTILLEGIKQSDDPFISTERVSQLFDNYLNRLKVLTRSNDSELRFWAASLLMHYNIADSIAENILLDTIRFGNMDKADVAAVILCRNKNQKVVYAIIERLKDSALSNKSRAFFVEKINDLAMYMISATSTQ